MLSSGPPLAELMRMAFTDVCGALCVRPQLQMNFRGSGAASTKSQCHPVSFVPPFHSPDALLPSLVLPC